MLYYFLWVIWILNFMCRRFGTLFIGGGVVWCLHQLRRWNWQIVPKRRHIKFKIQITQKKEYDIQNTKKVLKSRKILQKISQNCEEIFIIGNENAADFFLNWKKS